MIWALPHQSDDAAAHLCAGGSHDLAADEAIFGQPGGDEIARRRLARIDLRLEAKMQKQAGWQRGLGRDLDGRRRLLLRGIEADRRFSDILVAVSEASVVPASPSTELVVGKI